MCGGRKGRIGHVLVGLFNSCRARIFQTFGVPSHTALSPEGPEHPGRCLTHPSSHMLLSVQQHRGAAPALGPAIQGARKYYARAQEVRGDRILGRPGKESV